MKPGYRKKTKLFFYIFVALMPASLSLFGFCAATSTSDQIDQKQNQLEELQKKADVYKQIIELKGKQQDTLRNQIKILDTQIDKLQLDIDSNKMELGSLEQQISVLERKIDEKSRIIDAQRSMLASLIQAYYEEGRGEITLALLGSDIFSETINDSDHISQVGGKMKEVVEAMKSLKQTLEDEKNQLQKRKQEFDNLTYQLTERNSYLESNMDEKRRLSVQTRGEESRYKSLLNSVEEQQRAIEREIDDLESARVGSVDLGALPPSKKGYVSYPVNPVKISQGYGVTNFSKKAYTSGKHNGVDFAIDSGTPVYAVGSGKILATGNNGRYAYGKWVAIDHGNGLVTLYGHLNSQLVSKGKTVKQGDKIGLSGNTGFSTGPHVHLSVFVESTFELTESKIIKGLILPTGSSLNPMNYL